MCSPGAGMVRRYSPWGVVRQQVGAGLPLAAAQGLEGGRQGVEEGVVPVEDDGAAGAEVLQDLGLGLEDALPAAEKLNVGVADIGDDGDVGLHHLP